MEIKDYHSINEAKIEINKINVIGGVNGSGKSTLSRIFYSFLKGNSIKRRVYVLKTIIDNINHIIDVLDYDESQYGLPDYLEITDDYSKIIDTYNDCLKIYKEHAEVAETRISELDNEINNRINKIIKRLKHNGIDVNNNSDYFYDDYDDNSFRILSLSIIITQNNLSDYFSNDLKKLSELDHEYYYFSNVDDTELLLLLNNDSMNALFGDDSSQLSHISFSELLLKEYIQLKKDSYFNFYMGSASYDAFDYFFDNGFIDSAYYVDNVSIFDLLDSNFYVKKLFHMTEIVEDLFEKKEMFSKGSKLESQNQQSVDVLNILEKIQNIIKGSYEKDGVIFNTGRKENHIPYYKVFRRNLSKEGYVQTFNFDTPSGIKQIGIIQLLLLNGKLRKDGYLIIDEPEVNLHPEWQFKFAEILVLLAKDLNITIYLNSHSPFFIEAIDAFTEFYDMEEEITYYLTEESEVKGKYNFAKIKSDELYRIYDNLGNAYDLINQIRLRKKLDR